MYPTATASNRLGTLTTAFSGRSFTFQTRNPYRFDGIERTGVVNRINKRATVLVEDRKGARYSDGKHYAKFYVPVQMLEAVE
jgi:hypothetical protein